MFLSMPQTLVNFQRRTANFLTNEPVASSISNATIPQINCGATFIFSSAVTGTVTVTGTIDGSSESEIINISSNTVCVTFKLYSTITTIELSANIVSSGSTLTAKFIGVDGGSIEILKTVASGFPIQLILKNENLLNLDLGSIQSESPKAMMIYTDTFKPKQTDIITVIQTQNKYTIVGNPLIVQVGINQHWHLSLQRFEG